jgi:predicted MFS family arabinose efflux permease
MRPPSIVPPRPPEEPRVRMLLRGKLWRSPEFLKLWSGQSVSELGTAITKLALPTVAITLLHAGPVEVGALAAIQTIAYPVLGMVAGVWADRLRRRPILITCDIARMLLLASIPAAYVLGHLTMAQLFAVACGVGVFGVFFDVTYQSYLPSLVSRPDLVEGNGKLQSTRSIAQVAGPALAGLLIQAFRAAIAVAADAASFLVSVLTLLLIRAPEPKPEPAGSGKGGFWREMGEGLRTVFGHRTLRLVTAANTTSNFGGAILEAVFLIYAYRELHLTAGDIGGLYAVAAGAALLGASTAGRLSRVFGLGPLLAGAALLFRASYLAIPLLVYVHTPVYALGAILVVSRFWELNYNVNQLSLRQALVPHRLQGRSSAVTRTMTWGAIPVGSALGGMLGTTVGIVPTILLGAAVSMAAALWVLAGPVRLRSQPTADAEAEEPDDAPQLPPSPAKGTSVHGG